MANKEKKRKRAVEDDTEGPRKKPTTTPSTNTVKLNFVSKPYTLGPILASTPGLVIDHDLEFKAYAKPRTKTRNKFKPVYSDSELLLHSTTHRSVDYTAREGALGQDDTLKHYVGIYDPSTANVAVVEVRSMNIRSNIRRPSPDPEEKARQELEIKSYQEKRKELIEAFGSKKSLLRLEEYETNVKLLGGPPANLAGLEAELARARADGEDLTEFEKAQLAVEDKNRPLPRPNLETSVLSEAYPLPNLIENHKETLSALQIQSWQKSVAKGEAIQLTHRFPASRIVEVVKTKDATKIKTLQYLLILLQLHSSFKQAKGKFDNASVPKKEFLYKAIPASPNTAIVDAVKRKYVPEGTTVTSSSLTLLRTTICALTLHVDNFTTDVRDIVRDLDVDLTTIQKYYKDIGCKPYRPVQNEWARYNVQTKAQATALKVFKLKLPLEFPGPKKMKSVGGRGRRY